MNFISLEYLFFVLLLYGLVLVAGGAVTLYALIIWSLYFYGSWNWYYLVLLIYAVLIAYLSSIFMEKTRYKRITLFVSAVLIFSTLFYYKYYNFFGGMINSFMPLLSLDMHMENRNILLPIGISFFTFQAMAYVVDVYRAEVKAEKSFLYVLLFISFFPQLVAGPIERAGHLLPQLKALVARKIGGNVYESLYYLMKGVFVKYVVADNLGLYVTAVYENVQASSPWDAFFASSLFSFQIYGDFYGYTLIALGSAKLFGIDLMNNFAYPYFATSIQDFWRRWHISLSIWFRDYVYIPLGGSRSSKARNVFNLVVVMLLVGIWHGANYTFVLWGAAHGVFLAIHRVYRACIRGLGWGQGAPGVLRGPYAAVSWFLTYGSVSAAWVVFRAASLGEAGAVFGKIGSIVSQGAPAFFAVEQVTLCLVLAATLVLVDLFDSRFNLKEAFVRAKLPIKLAVFTLFVLSTYVGPENEIQFLYFQF